MEAAKQTNDGLVKFARYTIQQARTNLTKGGRNVSRKLYDSLGYEVKVYKRSFLLSFEMEDYGQFQDQGVKGKFSSARAPKSPFKFGTGTGKKGGLTDGIFGWVKTKRLQFRDRQTGKFLTYKQTSELIRNSIYSKGMKPTEFFSKPFSKGFEKLPKELITAYGLDIETFIKYATKDII